MATQAPQTARAAAADPEAEREKAVFFQSWVQTQEAARKHQEEYDTNEAYRVAFDFSRSRSSSSSSSDLKFSSGSGASSSKSRSSDRDFKTIVHDLFKQQERDATVPPPVGSHISATDVNRQAAERHKNYWHFERRSDRETTGTRIGLHDPMNEPALKDLLERIKHYNKHSVSDSNIMKMINTYWTTRCTRYFNMANGKLAEHTSNQAVSTNKRRVRNARMCLLQPRPLVVSMDG